MLLNSPCLLQTLPHSVHLTPSPQPDNPTLNVQAMAVAHVADMAEVCAALCACSFTNVLQHSETCTTACRVSTMAWLAYMHFL